MEHIVVKTEVQPNGEILLYYVDENGDVDGDQVLQLEEGTDYEILEAVNDANGEEILAPLNDINDDEDSINQTIQDLDQWSDEELRKLLIFYFDNKEAFLKGAAKKQHLWNVACKTMLVGKIPEDCDNKLNDLKKKYALQRVEHQKGYNVTWPLYNLSHQAFNDDSYVNLLLKDFEQQTQTITKVTIPVPTTTENKNEGILVLRNVNTSKSTLDDKVETMLNLYLRYKKHGQKEISAKVLWETIAMELGEESSEYWHKRFLNFKQHYLRMLAKRSVDGPSSISWVYMDLFDKIFSDDKSFQSRYVDVRNNKMTTVFEVPITGNDEWNDTECTVLAKYYFDCFKEFQDATIPNSFLWNEVGRLLDKKPDLCKKKYEEMKEAHYEKYFPGTYTLRSRIPLEILYDNIISKEVETEIVQDHFVIGTWTTDEVDQLVKFLYQSLELLKDSVCYFVCWACISRSLKKSIASSRKQWEELKTLYKSILNDKMENSDMQIDWRYIELFDRIFNYGMDTDLLHEDEKLKHLQNKVVKEVPAKKVIINLDSEPYENGTDDEEFDERGFTKRTKRPFGDSKAFKILEYYQKNKEKFSKSLRKKQLLWDVLAKQIGITGEQCAHRFRNLKQVYTAYVQREISKPEMPIIWPYYNLCKKVFGYRSIKSKLKNSQDSDETKEWSAKEIKQLIAYFGLHFEELLNSDDVSKWKDLAQDMRKTASVVKDKFVELRKSYRRLKTVKEHNPRFKVSWKYFNLFDEIYERTDGQIMETETYEVLNQETNEDEEDYQCIIVIPEGGDINDAQIIMKDGSQNTEILQKSQQDPQSTLEETQKDSQSTLEETQQDSQSTLEETQQDSQSTLEETQQDSQSTLEETQQDSQSTLEETQQDSQSKTTPIKWTKKSKRKLLILYHNYVKARKGQEINPKEMWAEIASKLTSKTTLSCRKMFAKLKANHLKLKDFDDENNKKSPYYTVLQKILALKPKFPKTAQKKLNEGKTFKDVLLPANKVELALQYYLQHIDEFTSPKFEKKYLWTELANFVSEPVNKLFNKINYLKQNYNVDTDEVAGEKTLFSELIREIRTKEDAIRTEITVPVSVEENDETTWSDDEIEQLLIWYLANLDKFKNPKFVRKYLWLEASSILAKSPLTCSKKMTEIRTQYKTMIKGTPDSLIQWRFYNLCQKIYGTGKKNENTNVTDMSAEHSV